MPPDTAALQGWHRVFRAVRSGSTAGVVAAGGRQRSWRGRRHFLCQAPAVPSATPSRSASIFQCTEPTRASHAPLRAVRVLGMPGLRSRPCRVCIKVSEPLVDRGDVDGGLVADGEFVVPGGRGAVAFEPVDAALHGVALLVDLRVEGRWPAAVGPQLAPGSVLIGLGQDGRLDPRRRRYRRFAREV
jgi:hypothetical protein